MSSIFLEHNPKKKFIISNVLHVPYNNKNLFNVFKFTKDNNIFIKFHANYAYMKDKSSGLKLMQGKLRNDIYAFDMIIDKSI